MNAAARLSRAKFGTAGILCTRDTAIDEISRRSWSTTYAEATTAINRRECQYRSCRFLSAPTVADDAASVPSMCVHLGARRHLGELAFAVRR